MQLAQAKRDAFVVFIDADDFGFDILADFDHFACMVHFTCPAHLGNVQQATLATVAPAIAEALIATAMGLFAAIPAVIAYNRYADQVSRLELRYDTFMEELSAILQRHAGGAQG